LCDWDQDRIRELVQNWDRDWNWDP